jgi:hypothetical protein
MIQSTNSGSLYRVRLRPKDVGVAVVVLVALALGWLLRAQTEGRVNRYQDTNSPFRIAYPTSWGVADSLQDVMLKVADPQTDSAFKTNLTVEGREIDPANPPNLQTLLDRRVEQRAALTGYHFLSNAETTVGGVNSMVFEYAYVTQPIDEPRRPSLPVVVQAREYIVAAKDRTYYITLAAPQNESEAASAQFDRIIQTVQIQ